jgi:HSP20 family protein
LIWIKKYWLRVGAFLSDLCGVSAKAQTAWAAGGPVDNCKPRGEIAMRTLVPFSWPRDLSRQNASDPFALLQSEVNRIFDGIGRFGTMQEFSAATPRLDVSETEGAIEIHAEIPGVAEKDVELTLAGDLLTIKGEKQENRDEKGRNFHLVERSYGSFSRSIRLPFVANPDSAKATFSNGVLSISVPKPKDQRTQSGRIPIS